MSKLGERLLLLLSRDPNAPDYGDGATLRYTLENALDFARKTIPDFERLILGQTVLDYGCGPGWQAVAMHRLGARRVVGVDINERWLPAARQLAEQAGCTGPISFHPAAPEELQGTFDVVVSLSSMEHFRDPQCELTRMRQAVRPGGLVVISFAEPWLSHSGSHMGFLTKVPWVNLLFSEQTVMRVRAQFRQDGATRYEEVEGGLNRMTLRKFERLIPPAGMRVELLKYYPTKGLPLVGRLPLVREFLISAATCVLRKAEAGQESSGAALSEPPSL
jgi:2-polyprenyl-3-methyl-5-hydroxy-6-metoxy-1,4-benzoquinol methylase